MRKMWLLAAVATAAVVVVLLAGQPATIFASQLEIGGQQSVMTSPELQPMPPPAQVTPAPPTLEQGIEQRCRTVYYKGVRKWYCSVKFPDITPPPPPPPPPPPTHDCPWEKDNPKCWGV